MRHFAVCALLVWLLVGLMACAGQATPDTGAALQATATGGGVATPPTAAPATAALETAVPVTSTAALTSTPAAPAGAALTVDQLRNATYGIEGQTIPLANGFFQGEMVAEGITSTLAVSLLNEGVALGDLNGDGAGDAVAVLSTNTGGTGNFRYLVVALNQAGSPAHVATTFLGDRTLIETGTIQAGEIVLEMVAHGSNDGACCPTLPLTQSYRLAGDQLQLVMSSELTWEILANLTYTIEGQTVALTTGVYEAPLADGTGTMRVAMDGLPAFGDLNGDGAQDAAVVLTMETGGTGRFRYLAAVANLAGVPTHVATAFLGDRVIVESVVSENGVVTVQMIAHGPGDGACCPTRRVLRSHILQGNQLVQTAEKDLGAATP